ncbi:MULTISPECIES: TetR/AcrR family transcriptional regulator [Comamonas]|uniref:TetR/AcrR family transcriptional regulator n=1 Tax=Comamonas TaxID=283 RepID=UPI00050E8AB8|nr:MULTISPECIES: TetR/AcrR family transcriptional regulator [Comamonas]KGG92456.1 TetR family transcriptional regulator [Comamonas thiooxydans]KGG98746.1 TetR family transcriptional regulator [Comamonas thiooxydans]KGH04411.1 TetR family transcriptional regulator [Comamonas thiooxydans]KGH12814.1 TetR family transcriptional regulator [Comamonas thiooxydans]TZG09038.1 TetR/AcrR family transcriptional regulator [Comamonas thiooxydans]
MKVSKAQAAENREGIVDAAARLYREKGLDGVGVAEITRDAGLTHGGLYRHFESKDALAREACLRAFEWTITPLDGLESSKADDAPATRLRALVHGYLSATHRDHPGEGCPAAALAADAARAGPEMSEVFAQGVERNIQRFMSVLQGDDAAKRTQTIVTLSSMVGALVLARATAAGNPALSEEILASLREQLAP